MCLFRFVKRIVLMIFVASILILLFQSKCSFDKAFDQVQDTVSHTPIAVTLPEEAMPAINRLKDQIAEQQGITADEITITRMEFILWPNTCMGSSEADCSEVITPGYKINALV